MKKPVVANFTLLVVVLVFWAWGNVSGYAWALPIPEDSGEPDAPLSAERAHCRWDLDELHFSPDGNRLVFTVAGSRDGISRQRDLWIMDVGSRRLRQYTHSRASDRHPRWSPDGTTLAFLSSRSGSSQIYLLPVEGGEPQLLAKSETSVLEFEWSPDGRNIAFVAPGPRKPLDEKVEVRIVKSYFYHDQEDPQLWVVDLETRKIRQLTSTPWRISHFYWAPNITWDPKSDHVLISATDDPQLELLTSQVHSVAIRDGAMTKIASPPGGFARLGVSPDGEFLTYLGPREDGFEYDDLYLKPLRGGEVSNLTAKAVNRRLWAYEWFDDDSVAFMALEGFQASFYVSDQTGHIEKLKDFNVPPSGHYGYKKPFAKTGEVLAYVGETTSQAPELWISTSPGKAEKVTDFNQEWDEIRTIPLEVVRFKSFDGTSIEAGILKPVDHKEGVLSPWVILIHGGPSAKWSDRFHVWGQMLASRGIGVLYPNVRGSTGYGYEFLTLNRYDWGGGDFKDVMAGADFLLEERLADPERLGVGGWSYGGYLSAWTITQTNRFKASVSGAPLTNLVSEYGIQDRWMNFYDTWYLGTPYENHQRFVERSPLTHVANVTANAQLMVGEQDDNGPLGQCLEFYRGLIRHGANARLIVYPNAGHFPGAPSQQIDVHKRFVAWFEEHLLP